MTNLITLLQRDSVKEYINELVGVIAPSKSLVFNWNIKNSGLMSVFVAIRIAGYNLPSIFNWKLFIIGFLKVVNWFAVCGKMIEILSALVNT